MYMQTLLNHVFRCLKRMEELSQKLAGDGLSLPRVQTADPTSKQRGSGKVGRISWVTVNESHRCKTLTATMHQIGVQMWKTCRPPGWSPPERKQLLWDAQDFFEAMLTGNKGTSHQTSKSSVNEMLKQVMALDHDQYLFMKLWMT